MSDKNPYYSIPKALGSSDWPPIEMLPVDPKMIEMVELYEKFRRDIYNIMLGRTVT